MTADQLIDHIKSGKGGNSIRDLLDLGCDAATYWAAYTHLSRTLPRVGAGAVVETHRYDECGERSAVPTYSCRTTSDDALLHNIWGAYARANAAEKAAAVSPPDE